MRKRWIMTTSLLIIAVGGVSVWTLTTVRGSTVSLPKRVCRGVVPSKNMEYFFPRHGDAFKEVEIFGFESHAGTTGGSSDGSCNISAGGERLDLSYHWILENDINTDMTEEGISREAAKPGSTPVSVGLGRGYIKKQRVTVFVACPFKHARHDVLELSIDGKPIGEKHQDSKIVDLTRDFLQSIIGQVVNCQGKANLPNNALIDD